MDLPMVELVAATGLSLTPAYPCRFDPRAVDAKRRIEAGDIGRILAMHATNHLKKTPEGWFVDPQLSGGGTIMDHIVHGMDLMRWFGGREVVEIYAEAATLARPGLGVDDVAMLVLAFDGGAIGSCDPSWNRPLKSVSWGDVSVRILGTKGALEFDLTGQYFTRTLDAGEEGGSGASAVRRQYERVADEGVRGGGAGGEEAPGDGRGRLAGSGVHRGGVQVGAHPPGGGGGEIPGDVKGWADWLTDRR